MANEENQSESSAGGNSGEYGVDQMRYMSDLEHVRERTGMYIGNRDVRGMHHLVTEVVDNSIDEVMNGHARIVSVTVNRDNSITVEDDGRGIPVHLDPSIGKPALEGVMTMLKYGGKFDNNSYKVSGGLHGVGVSVVNALSDWLKLKIWRDGHLHQIEFRRGEPVAPLAIVGPSNLRGTEVHFMA